MSALDIEVVVDVVCPWCLIGEAHLARAVSESGREVAIRFAPFLLDPSIPDEGVDLRAHLAAKFGNDTGSMFSRVESVARAAGIPLDFSKIERFPSTVRAHALIALAEGRADVARAVFRAYFLESRDVSDVDVLVSIGTAHGLDADAVRTAITSRASLDAIRTRAATQPRRGIRGVPFFVFDGRLAVSGAQPVAVLIDAMKQAATSPAAPTQAPG